MYRKDFVRGPFHLGAFSYPVAIAASLWIALISILFMLPTLTPVGTQTLNYSVVAVGIVITYSLGLWVISARKVRRPFRTRGRSFGCGTDGVLALAVVRGSDQAHCG